MHHILSHIHTISYTSEPFDDLLTLSKALETLQLPGIRTDAFQEPSCLDQFLINCLKCLVLHGTYHLVLCNRVNLKHNLVICESKSEIIQLKYSYLLQLQVFQHY